MSACYTKNFSDIEKLRYVYLDLGKRFSFNLDFSFGNSETKKKIYNKSHKSNELEQSMENNTIICTLSGQWKTMGKLFASMAVPLTINRVTTALFNSLENLLIPQKLQAFGYSASDALSIFGILTGMTMSIILFPSVLTNSFSVLLLPAVSEAHSAHNHAQIARTIKKAILYGLLLGFVFTILFLVFGARMGEVLFHNTLAGNFICQLSWLCPLLYVTSLLNSILHGLGNARQVLFVTLLACMIRICMILFLVPQYGIDAYLWGMLLSYVFAAIADILLLMPYSRAG